MIKDMKKNPFEIRKSPSEIIAAQAIALDDYVKLQVDGRGVSCMSAKEHGPIVDKQVKSWIGFFISDFDKDDI